MSKLTITNDYNAYSATGNYFVVLNDNDATPFVELAEAVIVLSAPEGKKITDWTPKMGLAEDDFEKYPLSSRMVYLMVPATVRENEKTKKFIKEFRTFIINSGGGLTVPALDPGVTVFNFGKHMSVDNPTDGLEAAEKQDVDEDDAATLLYGMVTDNFTLCRSKDNKSLFLLPNEKAGLGLRAYLLGSPELKQWMYRTYRKTTGKIIPGGGVVSVVDATLEGECAISEHKYDLASRSAMTPDGSVWIDLGNDTGSVVRVSDGVWATYAYLPYNTGVAFRRPNSITEIQAPVAVPVGDARMTLEMYLKPYVNAKDADWPLITAWMINHLIPGHNSPILMLLGGSGAGKSTACSAVKYAVEGGISLGTTKKFKDNEDDIMVAMSKARVSTYDNVSKVSADLSDTLCQVVYGTEYEKRKLRTDDEEFLLKVDSSLILNGIETGQLRGDLKSRMVHVELNEIVDFRTDLQTWIVETHPQVFGAIMSLMASILPQLASAPTFPSQGPEGYRMQHYVRVLWALDQIWGTNGVEHYRDSLNAMSSDLLDDPFLLSVASLVSQHGTQDKNGVWTATIGVSEIHTKYESSTFIERIRTLMGEKEQLTIAGMGGKITRAQNEWSRLGITLKKYESKDGRKLLRGKQQVAYHFTIDNPELINAVKQDFKI